MFTNEHTLQITRKRRHFVSFSQPPMCSLSEEEIPLSQHDQLAMAVAQGKSITEWARQNGVPKRTAQRWASEPDIRLDGVKPSPKPSSRVFLPFHQLRNLSDRVEMVDTRLISLNRDPEVFFQEDNQLERTDRVENSSGDQRCSICQLA